ncbi:PLP-dependent aminotransferase family protein [Marinimicrobium sp. ABcell2]|uniref:aminotransferase-like domain-containing protein n=1 Tax=Marinimicrobium sp. ABcell2 TaxID=3069751 RepID=UPI0027B144DB|nr:PLP-dependent aminotransferase family protein [Marinimicrobium sp. ABcell2]MDQ2076720.1 PLP-dependent aminotransferase family protein [Marinimicrobium sp. ABcell2]
MFKYQQLAEQLSAQIMAGDLRPGDRLPSLRQYARRHAVSLNTATKIFTQLEARGLVSSQQKSGFYVRAKSDRAAPQLQRQKAVLVAQDKSDLLINLRRNASRPGLIDLGAGILDPSLLPITELQRAVRRVSKRHANAITSYGDPEGLWQLREAIGELMSKRQDRAPRAEQLLITNGCLEAVNLCIQTLTRPGDVVAVLTPCYNGLLALVQRSGRRVLEVPCDSQGPDLDYLEQLLEYKAFQCLIFSAVAFNPLGFSMSAAEKIRLAALAARYRTHFIEDDTFGELAYGGVEPSPVFAQDHGGYIYYCSSFSKSLAPGFRLGWVARQAVDDQLVKHKMALNLGSNLGAQYALADYLYSGGFSAHLSRLRRAMEASTARAHQTVSERFPQEVRVLQPTGGFFLWLQLPCGQQALELYHKALQENIVFAPGNLFSLASLHDDKLRLSCAKPWTPELEVALHKLGDLVAEAG